MLIVGQHNGRPKLTGSSLVVAYYDSLVTFVGEGGNDLDVQLVFIGI